MMMSVFAGHILAPGAQRDPNDAASLALLRRDGLHDLFFDGFEVNEAACCIGGNSTKLSRTCHHLLHEDEAPELVGPPHGIVHRLLRCHRALEGVEAEVRQEGPVDVDSIA